MDVRLPRLGEGADSGTVSSIFVKEGDTVKKDQPVLELESDKAVASIPSPVTGQVARLHVKEGDLIKVGQVIFSLSHDGGAPAPVIDASVGDEPGEEGAVEVADEALPPATEAETELPEVPRNGRPPAASPTIRKMARELGIDLTLVPGSERGGRIVLSDLRRYVQRLQQIAARAKSGAPQAVRKPEARVDFSRWGPIRTTPMSTLRKAISNKMAESWTTIPHVTQFDEADITGLLALRKKHAPRYEKEGGHLTLTTFALRAVVDVLKKHPAFNSSMDEVTQELIYKQYYHVGIAVDTEQGLIVPVIRDVDKKSLLELAIELSRLAEKTRERKVTIEEMQGGSFTISNQGGIGSGHFTPIINKPEVAILGIGRSTLKPVFREEGKTEKRMMLPLALSYDHRVVDGADAARFMVDLVKALESFKEAEVKI